MRGQTPRPILLLRSRFVAVLAQTGHDPHLRRARIANAVFRVGGPIPGARSQNLIGLKFTARRAIGIARNESAFADQPFDDALALQLLHRPRNRQRRHAELPRQRPLRRHAVARRARLHDRSPQLLAQTRVNRTALSISRQKIRAHRTGHRTGRNCVCVAHLGKAMRFNCIKCVNCLFDYTRMRSFSNKILPNNFLRRLGIE